METSAFESRMCFDQSCPICLEELPCNGTVSELDSCRHVMCEECFKSMINFSNKCPLCLKIFTSCVYRNSDKTESEYIITEKELRLMEQNRNSALTEETFECFGKEEIRRELGNYKKMMESIQVSLFLQRNADGSPKECRIFEELTDRMYNSTELIQYEPFDVKCVMKDMDCIVRGVADLQSRKYKNHFECSTEEDEYININMREYCDYEDGFNCTFHIEYVERKKTGSKKKKKR